METIAYAMVSSCPCCAIVLYKCVFVQYNVPPSHQVTITIAVNQSNERITYTRLEGIIMERLTSSRDNKSAEMSVLSKILLSALSRQMPFCNGIIACATIPWLGCSIPQGSPGVGRNTFLSSPHLCFIIVLICYLFVSRDDLLMSWKTFARIEQLYVLSHDRSWRRGWDPVKPV